MAYTPQQYNDHMETGISDAYNLAGSAFALATAGGTGSLGTATPFIDGTAAPGTSILGSRQDHVHPTDTTRAALVSPTFTGTPLAPTAAPSTNTTQLATTAFVLANASGTVTLGTVTPLINGTAAPGTSVLGSHQDHVHPTDTTRAPLASPTFTGAPLAPTATPGTNTTQLATTAFVLANAAGTVALTPAAAAYTITTNGTAMTAYTSTGSIAATNTDLGALVNGLAASLTSFRFGTGVFPWTTTMVLNAFTGVTLSGQGGRQNESKGAVGGASATQFKWTPASGQAFTAAGSQGLTVDGIGFQWTNASYVSGDGTKDGTAFLSIEGVDHSTPTRHAVFRNCYFGAASSGKLDSGGPVVDVNKTVNIAFRDCIFSGGTMSVRSHHLNSTDDFANVVDFTACRFARNKAPTSTTAGWPTWYGSGNTWSFRACHWEPSAGGPIYIHETQIEPASNHTYEDSWVGDQSGTPVGTAAFINWHGNGLRIVGGHYDCTDGYSILKTNAISHGVFLSGLDVISPDHSTTGGLVNCSGAVITDLVLSGIGTYPATNAIVGGNLTEPPRIGQIPYKALSANKTLTHQEHDRVFGVDATAGAITITLPAVTCVGFKVTVKKTDSSVNAVTVARASTALIDGASTVSLAAQYDHVAVISDGTNWNKV